MAAEGGIGGAAHAGRRERERRRSFARPNAETNEFPRGGLEVRVVHPDSVKRSGPNRA